MSEEEQEAEAASVHAMLMRLVRRERLEELVVPLAALQRRLPAAVARKVTSFL